jgi:hypothetical protein
LDLGAALIAHRQFTEWTRPACGGNLHRSVLDELGNQGLIDWSRAVLDGASVRATKGGELTGPNPVDRGKPASKIHAPPDPRACHWPWASPQRTPTTVRLSSPGQSRAARAVSPWTTPSASGYAARGQGIRRRPPAGLAVPTRDHPAHRPQGHRVHQEAGQTSVGDRTIHRLAVRRQPGSRAEAQVGDSI